MKVGLQNFTENLDFSTIGPKAKTLQNYTENLDQSINLDFANYTQNLDQIFAQKLG